MREITDKLTSPTGKPEPKSSKLQVGTTVWLRHLDQRRGADNTLQEYTVSKIGNKYFQLNECGNIRFFIDTLTHDGKPYTAHYQCYLSPTDYYDEVEERELNRFLPENIHKLSLDEKRSLKIRLTAQPS